MRRFRLKYPRLWFFLGLTVSALAFFWRRLMCRTSFIAVTGSLGKTTATRCLAAILSSRFPTNTTRRGGNGRRGIAATILRTRFRHRFTVLELGTKKPGALRRGAWLLAPDTAVILAVAGVHTNNFPTLEDLAAEKSALLSRLGRRGLAILNGDDPRVAAMARGCRGKVVTFGTSPHLDVWASEVSSRWPARLSFRVHHGADSRQVRTKLVGEHWLASTLAALAAALWNGVDLESAASALEQVEPSRGRMEPVALPSGAILLRDDCNSSYASLPAALRVLEQAEGRRVLVFTEAYDSGLSFRERFQRLGQMAASSVDLAVFFGERSRNAARRAVEGGMPSESVRSFPDLWGAAEFLRSELREGDLALLRDCHPFHAERIWFALAGSVGCRMSACSYLRACDYCAHLRPGLEETRNLPAPARPFWEPD